MRAFISSVYLFLYAPIALVVLFSFNAGRNASEFTGFSLAWYGKALGNTFLVSALQNSLIIAFTSATLAAVFGTMAALGMERLGSRMRALFDALFAAAIVVPGVVIGIATLVALVAVFSFVNPTIAALWPDEQPPQLGLGYGSIIAAHGLFSMALVTMIVKARIASLGRDIVEASGDAAHHFQADRAAADPAVDPRGLSPRFHLLLRRLHHRLLRRRLEDDPADLCLRLDPPRGDAGNQRYRDPGPGRLAVPYPDRPRAHARKEKQIRGVKP
jgi:hypothetical protein